MIGRVTGGFPFRESASGTAGRQPDGVEEFLRGDVGRAGCGHQQATLGQAGESPGGEALIGADGVGPFGFAPRERRWIQDHQIKGLFRCLGEPVENVGLNGFVGAASDGFIRDVEAEVSPGAIEGVGAEIDTGDRDRAAARGIEREAAAETKGVQDAPVAGQRFHQPPVFPLIEEEAGFLAEHKVGLEFQARFAKNRRAIRRGSEQGLPVDSNNWYALFVPARTPPDTVAALNRATRAALAAPAVNEKLLASGAVPTASSPQELTALMRQDTEKWAKLIRAKKIVAE